MSYDLDDIKVNVEPFTEVDQLFVHKDVSFTPKFHVTVEGRRES
jgi:hypothetical protein